MTEPRTRLARLIDRGTIALGWSVAWRFALVMIPVRILAELVAAGQQSGGAPLGALGILVMLPVGGNAFLIPVAVPIALFGLDWAGKRALRKRGAAVPSGFIGWSLYWRAVLLVLAGMVVLGLVFVPITFLARAAGPGSTVATALPVIAALVLLPALVAWALNAYGLALRQAAERARTFEAPGVRPAGPPEDLSTPADLFDRERFGDNYALVVAFCAASVLGPFLWWSVHGVLGTGGASAPSAEVLAQEAVFGAVQGFALVAILGRVRSIGLQVAAVGAAFAAVNLAAAVLLDWGLSGVTSAASGFAFGALFMAGLALGIRLRGPLPRGLILGLGGAFLVQSCLVVPALFSYELRAMDLETGFFHHEFLLPRAIKALLDAGVFGAGTFLAVRAHLGRRGLRLAGRRVVPADGG